MGKKKTVKDVELSGRRVFCRVDFNVPVNEGVIQDDTRIVAALPTIKHILDSGGRLVLASHLGRPKGQVKPELSLKPCAEHLSTLLGKEVKFAPDCVGDEAVKLSSSLADGEVMLLENVRFHKEEKLKDTESPEYVEFSRKLAATAEMFVSDAFGTAHRAHASMVGAPRLLSPRVAGFLMEKEINYFSEALDSPKRPLVVILGGAKVSDKIKVIENLLNIADVILIGGAMAYTFYLAQGGKVGSSLVEPEQVEMAGGFLAAAKEKGKKILLPQDTICADRFTMDSSEAVEVKTVEAGQIPDGWQGMDIGPESIKAFEKEISLAATVIWNGPMGVFENEKFAAGTNAVAAAVADSSAVSIIGGGDSVSAIKKSGLADKIDHISTGGGASLELLEGKILPGLAILDDA